MLVTALCKALILREDVAVCERWKSIIWDKQENDGIFQGIPCTWPNGLKNNRVNEKRRNPYFFPLYLLKKHLVLPQVTQIISKDVLKFLKTIRAASKLNIMAYADLAEESLCRVWTKEALPGLLIVWCLFFIGGEAFIETDLM